MAGHELTLTRAIGGAEAAAVHPRIRVEMRSAEGELATLPLGLDPIVIGTGSDAELRVTDPAVSRRHVELRLTERGILLRDLGSKNGTFVGGVRLLEAVLTEGTEVRLGDCRLRVVPEGGTVNVALHPEPRFGAAMGLSVRMRALFARLARAASSSEPVLLLGESGTGKELLARAIHDASPRAEGPFVIFDCSAVVANLVETELFGHAKGSFTGAEAARAGLFEHAHGGTLLIDELGELPRELQPKLLRVLETGQIRPVGGNTYRDVDVRVVAATHRDIRHAVATNDFRTDLYYRLAVVEAEIPPLRDRPEDIPLLVEELLRRLDPPRRLTNLPPGAMEMLQAHGWPGNVRELRNTVARLVLFPDDPASAIRPPPADDESSNAAASELFLHLPLREAREEVVDAFERRYLAAKLAQSNGSIAGAARLMGVSRQFAHRLCLKLGLAGRDG